MSSKRCSNWHGAAPTNALGEVTVYEYNPQGRKTHEDGGTYPVRFTDDEGRMTGMTTYRDESGPGDTTAWTYDAATGVLLGKTYADGKGPLNTYTSVGKLATSTWSHSYEPHRNLISAVEDTYGPAIISRFDYVNDEIGRRTSRADSGIAFDNPAFDKYSYNERSEVIGAQRYHGTVVSDMSSPYGGRGFGYDYDPIGNRLSATESIGGETLAKSYTANELNQYTAIANPDAVGLRGSATNTATVTVNGNAASRDNIASDTVPWHYALLADNANGGAYSFAEIMAVVNPPGTNTPDVVESTSGSVYAPPRAEVLAYDDDGNLLSDGRWEYTWNGENRLICAEEQVCPTNRTLRKVEYVYDHQGRMVWKKISRGGAEAQSWEDEKATSYLWDAYNIIAETVSSDSATNTTYNVWGLDVDGTLQGAGGVGGLLAVVSPLPLGDGQGEGGTVYLPCYDANGNIMEYVAEDGAIVAHREYDPFGGTVVYTCQSAINSPQSAVSFTHWFSTKPWCEVTGLSEYQYRKYSPVMGRWLSRDPIGEGGGVNLSCVVDNDALDYCDILGRKKHPPKKDGPPYPNTVLRPDFKTLPKPGYDPASVPNSAASAVGGLPGLILDTIGSYYQETDARRDGMNMCNQQSPRRPFLVSDHPSITAPICKCCVVTYYASGFWTVFYEDARGVVVNKSCEEASRSSYIYNAERGSLIVKYYRWG